MKKSLFIIIFLFVFAIATVPSLAKITDHYLTSPNYYEKVYQKNPTTYNLLVLCDSCLENSDEKYFVYIDRLLSAEDFDQAINEFWGYDETKSLVTENALRISTVGISAFNNNMDDFEYSMKKYYIELESGDRPQFFIKFLLV